MDIPFHQLDDNNIDDVFKIEDITQYMEDYPSPSAKTVNPSYTHVVKSSPLSSSIPFTIDSGADAHMCNDRRFFLSIEVHPLIPFIRLANGNNGPPTQLKCEGVGTLDLCFHGGKRIQLHNALFVPELGTSLFSINTHVQTSDCAVLSKNKETCVIFPDFNVTAPPGASIVLQAHHTGNSKEDISCIAQTPPPIFHSLENAAKQLGGLPPPFTSFDSTVSVHKELPPVTVSFLHSRSTFSHSIPTDKGFTLSCCSAVSIPPYTGVSIPSGIQLTLPQGIFARYQQHPGNTLDGLVIHSETVDPSINNMIHIRALNQSPSTIAIPASTPLASLFMETTSHVAFQSIGTNTHVVSPDWCKQEIFNLPCALQVDSHTDNILETVNSDIVPSPVTPELSPLQSSEVIPVIRVVDKVSSTIPKNVTFTTPSKGKEMVFLRMHCAEMGTRTPSI